MRMISYLQIPTVFWTEELLLSAIKCMWL